MRVLALLVLSSALACSDAKSSADGPPPDAAPPDGGLAGLSCKQLSDLAVPLMGALDRSCAGDGDCVLVFVPGVLPSCDRIHILGSIDRAARKGWVDAQLSALIAEYHARCETSECSSANPCIADWAPARVSCAQKTCEVIPGNCFPMPDARP